MPIVSGDDADRFQIFDNLHSRYNPLSEADRLLASVVKERIPSVLVLISPCRDYLAEAARRRFPGSRIVSLQPDTALRGKERPGADCRWYPDSPVGLSTFLDDALRDAIDGGVSVVEWRPLASRYPEVVGSMYAELANAMKAGASERASVRFWSSLWLRNACRNALRLESTYRVVAPGRVPALVVCSGPSAAGALSAIGGMPSGRRPLVVSVASAYSACVARGVFPDVIVSTDPGFWNAFHATRVVGSVVAMPLTASVRPIGVTCTHGDASCILVIDQRSTAETDIATRLGISTLKMDPHGSVAGTAIGAAFSLTDSDVYVTGLDLASLDIVSHIAPNGLDRFIARAPTRLLPAYNSVWKRETELFPVRDGAYRFSRAFDAYARAFSVAPPTWRKIFRVSGSPARLDALPDIALADFQAVMANFAWDTDATHAPIFERTSTPPLAERRIVIASLIAEWTTRAADAIVARSIDRSVGPDWELVEALAGSGAKTMLAEAARGHDVRPFVDRTVIAVRDGAAQLAERLGV